MLPYETLSGANYGIWMRPRDGYYVSSRTPPLYTNARSPPTAVNSLAPFLPRPGPSGGHLYPSLRPSGAKSSSRPYSADVGRLISVAEVKMIMGVTGITVEINIGDCVIFFAALWIESKFCYDFFKLHCGRQKQGNHSLMHCMIEGDGYLRVKTQTYIPILGLPLSCRWIEHCFLTTLLHKMYLCV